jgi:hypothetical protein
VTIVCCVEAGALEAQTITMVRSLRTFAGELANVPVIAVVGRRGAPLRTKTNEELGALGVRLVYAAPRDNPAPWFGYANKAAAVATAQKLANTETIAWVDSDVLFVKPPTGLILEGGCDFAARCEFLPPAVHEGDGANVAYWRAVCDLFGVDFASVPWIDGGEGRPPQKMFFNSGIFVWRRSTNFAQAYQHAFARLLRSRLSQADGTFHFIDQVILTPTVLGDQLRWCHLARDEHFMIFQGFIDGADAAPDMSGAQLLHYSKSLQPPFRQRFLERLRKELPHIHSFVTSSGDADIASGTWSPLLSALRVWRGARWRLHGTRVRPCVDQGQRE